MWGIVPAAGQGSRMQPLAFSKELLPVGSRVDGERERPRPVSEYLVERLIRGGADKLCFVMSPGKSDILEYYGGDPQTRIVARQRLGYRLGLQPGALRNRALRLRESLERCVAECRARHRDKESGLDIQRQSHREPGDRDDD